MKRLALFVLIACSSAPAAIVVAEPFDPCALLTRREIQEIQKDRVVSTKASEPERDRFAVSQCFYTLATFSKSISLEVTRRRAGAADSPRDHWKQMFGRALEKRKEKEVETEKGERGGEAEGEREREEGARPFSVTGIGDEAFWDGSALGGGLFVRKGDAYLRLSIGGPDPVPVKIERLKKLARHALHRLP